MLIFLSFTFQTKDPVIENYKSFLFMDVFRCKAFQKSKGKIYLLVVVSYVMILYIKLV